MDRRVIIFSLRQINIDSRDYVAKFLQSICEQCKPAADDESHRELLSGARVESLQVALVTKPLMTSASGWLEVPVSSTIDDISTILEAAQFTPECYTDPSNADSEKLDLADIFHTLADSLPKQSGYVDVLWLSHLGMTTVSEDIALFGALKRLVVWHQAQMYLTSASDEALSEEEQQWVDLLHAEVLPSAGQRKNAIWRGFVTLTEEQGAKITHLPGFSLHQPPVHHCPIRIKESRKSDEQSDHLSQVELSVMSPCLDFLSMLPRCQVPDFYVSHHCYSLSVSSPSRCLHKSRQIIRHLNQNPNLCYLVRLSYGSSEDQTSTSVTKKKSEDSTAKKRTTNDWRDLVIDDITNAINYEPERILSTIGGHHHFLLQASSDHSDNSCAAHLFKPLDTIDGAIGHHLAMLGISAPDRQKCGELDDEFFDLLLQDLPFHTGDELVTVHDTIERLQAETLEYWIELQKKQGQPTAMTFAKLTQILKAVRDRFQEFMSTIPDCKRPQPKHVTSKILPIKPETEWNMETTLERAALMLHDTQQNEFKKTKSNGSLGGLSPPPHGKILTLDASEFLKFFKPDGTAVNPNLKPVRQKSPSKRLCKFDSSDALDTKWPDICQVRYHDIYYHRADIDERDVRCSKLKARTQAVEMASTCSYKQAQSPATMVLRTPRKEKDQTKDSRAHARGSKLSPRAKLGKFSPGAKSRRLSPGWKSPRKAKRRMVPSAKPVSHKAAENAASRELHRGEASQPTKKSKTDDATSAGAAGDKTMKESRSQRHKRKLEEVVKAALVSHGLTDNDPIFAPCASRLFTLVKCFVKDLATSHNLREEMINLANEHVSSVIEFQRKRAINKQKT